MEANYWCLCGRIFTNSISLGVHILKEHSGGICLLGIDFNFDLDFICAIRNVPAEQNCDSQYLDHKQQKIGNNLEEDCSFDDEHIDPKTDNKIPYEEEEQIEYDSSNGEEEEELEYDSSNGEDEDESDINVNGGDNVVELDEIIAEDALVG